MSDTTTSAQHDVKSFPWIVEFTELRAIEEIDPRVLRSILDIWLEVVTPDAHLIEPKGSAARFAVFDRRDDQRKFLRTFGGRKLNSLPSELLSA